MTFYSKILHFRGAEVVQKWCRSGAKVVLWGAKVVHDCKGRNFVHFVGVQGWCKSGVVGCKGGVRIPRSAKPFMIVRLGASAKINSKVIDLQFTHRLGASAKINVSL